MDKLYSPWRDRYVNTQIKGQADGACVFCEVFTDDESDESRLVLFRNQDIAVLLNLYPYNGGHLLVVPRTHVAEFYELSQPILHQMMNAASKSMQIMKKEFNCDGINFGANIGRAGGAGIPQHIHMHIVPRFAGDTGFFTTIGSGKQVSVDLERIYKNLKPHFDQNFIG